MIARLEVGTVEKSRYEVIHLCSGIRDTEWSEDHHEELEHLETGGVHTKSKYVFIALDEMVVWQTINVAGIVKISVAFS